MSKAKTNYKSVQVPVWLINIILKYKNGFYRSHSEAVIDGTRKIAKELIQLNYQMTQLAQEEIEKDTPKNIKKFKK